MSSVRSICMDWSIPDTTFSEYYNTLQGQIEYWLLWAMLGQMSYRAGRSNFPMFWYGAENSIGLYLEHCSYSPFLDNPRLGHPKMILAWDMRNVPEGQESSVDENFIPRLREL